MPEMQQREPSTTTTNDRDDLIASTTAGHPRTPHSLPPWLHINDGTERAPPSPPEGIHPNTRHYKPPPPHYKPGRKWDHLREAEPPYMSAPIAEHQARWTSFMHAGPNPVEHIRSRVVDREWMDENMPDLMPDWQPEEDELGHGAEAASTRGLMYKGKWLISPERQERTVRLFWRLLLKNPFVPLACRLAVLAFSVSALGVAASIYHTVDKKNNDANPDTQCAPRASTYMALIVDTIAIPYLGYVTWDEYFSKPLGLRSVPAKILLLLCDLYFVVFSASNLSLAFDALYDHRWACYSEKFEVVGDSSVTLNATCPGSEGICKSQKALAAVLFIGLMAWLMTFSLSVMRVVEKLRPD